MVYMNTNPSQTQLIPTNLRNIIEDGHICYLIEELAHSLDYTEFDEEVAGPGFPSYHPRIKIKILIYGVLEGVTSSRKLEKLTHENVVFRYLSESTNPDFHTIAMFRKENPDIIEKCFLQTVFLAKKMGLINSQCLYLDGTKIIANASKKNNFSEQELEFLLGYVKDYLQKMDNVDKAEDKKFGKTNGEVVIPEHLRNKRKLKDAIKGLLNNPDRSFQRLQSACEQAKTDQTDRVNLTDPDSKLMRLKSGNSFKQAFNCQLIVEDKSEIIMSTKVDNDPTDVGLAIPTIQKYSRATGFDTKDIELSMDNGYMSHPNIKFFEENQINAYMPGQTQTQLMKGKPIPMFHVDNFELDFKGNQVICPKGQILFYKKKRMLKRKKSYVPTNVYECKTCEKCDYRTECIKGKDKNKLVEINPLIRRFSMQFLHEKVQKVYKKRFHKGEVAQAHILHNLKFREFRLRSVKSVQTEFDLAAIAYNLRKIKNKGGLRGNPINYPTYAA